MRGLRADAWVSSRGVFTLAFFHSFFVGLLIQLVILPFVMPELDAGHGLLKGGDWIWFHQEAVQLANRIHREGWAVWELRPQGNAPIGIAAVAYVVAGIGEPWVLMPLNAGLFAIGATCLYMTFALIAPHQLAFAATLPYVLFPSAAVIFAQIHKDVWSIAGIALVTLVWGRFAVYSMPRWTDAGIQLVLILAGIVLVWLVRPYLVKVVLVASILTVVVVICDAFMHKDGAKHSLPWWVGGLLSIALLVIFAKFPVNDIPETMEPAPWNPTKSIPAAVDDSFFKLAQSRRRFSEDYPHAGSNIDTEVTFHSAADVARYLPRALQIALFAPFPDMWGGTGTSPGAGLMRVVAAIEMALSYLLLPGVVLLFMRGGLQGPQAVVLIQAVVPMVILALVVSNGGTLYRMRFLNLQTLNGMGMIGWVLWLQYWNTKFRKIPD